MSRSSRRSAFTLVEMLVVFGIFAVTIGLFFPAIQKIRHTTGRMRCTHNLRQLGLALHTYHDMYGLFPPAHSRPRMVSEVPPAADSRWYFSWMTRILPFIEQDNLYRQINFHSWPWWQSPLNETTVTLFQCPMDSRQYRSAPYEGHRVALTGYLGVSGTDESRFDGIMHVNARQTFLTVRDGTSHTLLVGERPPSKDLLFGWWFAGAGRYPYFGTSDVVLGVHERGHPYGPGRIDNQDDEWHFWSLHQGGSNFLFADSSVHFVRYDIGQDVINALATRAGGEVANCADI